MNLFATDPHPAPASIALDDLRLRKMILETAQLLCTELRRRGKDYMPYRPTHPMHPVTLSLRHNPTLWWTFDYFELLHVEYIHRFGKTHKSYRDCILKFRMAMPAYADPSSAILHNSARNLSHGIDYTHLPVHEAYRRYLSARWSIDYRPPTWTNRQPPSWKSP